MLYIHYTFDTSVVCHGQIERGLIVDFGNHVFIYVSQKNIDAVFVVETGTGNLIVL